MTDDLFGLFDEPIPVRKRETSDAAKRSELGRILVEYRENKLPTEKFSIITCRVCSRRENQSIDTPGLLCSTCRSDIPAASLLIDRRRQAIEERERAARARWKKIGEELDDVTCARFARLMEARSQAEHAARAARLSYPASMSLSDAVARQREADAALAAVYAKIARSRAAGDALSDVIEAEDQYLDAIDRAARDRIEADLAMQAIEATFGDLPF